MNISKSSKNAHITGISKKKKRKIFSIEVMKSWCLKLLKLGQENNNVHIFMLKNN